MIFNQLAPRATLFIDANIFIYHFTGLSEQCSELLKRCQEKQLNGFLSTSVYAEILHRLMMLEAVSKKLVEPPNVAKKIKAKPTLIKSLTDSFLTCPKILKMNIKVLTLTQEDIVMATKHSQAHGLMINDALILACMLKAGIKNLATADKDFSSIPFIKLYQPEDI